MDDQLVYSSGSFT